jgi:hypothetical protein
MKATVDDLAEVADIIDSVYKIKEERDEYKKKYDEAMVELTKRNGTIARKNKVMKDAIEMLKQFDGTGVIIDLLWLISTEEVSDEK